VPHLNNCFRNTMAQTETAYNQLASVGPVKDDVDAIDLVHKISTAIKDKGWTEHPGIKPLVVELTAGNFM
jgi:hypothetical protein